MIIKWLFDRNFLPLFLNSRKSSARPFFGFSSRLAPFTQAVRWTADPPIKFNIGHYFSRPASPSPTPISLPKLVESWTLGFAVSFQPRPDDRERKKSLHENFFLKWKKNDGKSSGLWLLPAPLILDPKVHSTVWSDFYLFHFYVKRGLKYTNIVNLESTF